MSGVEIHIYQNSKIKFKLEKTKQNKTGNDIFLRVFDHLNKC